MSGFAGRGGAAAKAAVLIQSLPRLRGFRGKIIVVKYGGNAMIDEQLKREFAADMVYLRQVGVHPVVVHGGGPQISARLAERQITTEFRGGLRVTTPEVMAVVRDVLLNEVNAEVASLIDQQDGAVSGPAAARFSGETGGLFAARRRTGTVDGEEVDIGLVGDVVRVDPSPVLEAIAGGRIPVVSSIAPDIDAPRSSLNVNADSAAGALAVALGAAKLIVLTDVAGLYRDWPDTASMVTSIRADELEHLLPTLQSGMIPKMTACLDAVRNGVGSAGIIDGREPHAILQQLFDEGTGTEVTP